MVLQMSRHISVLLTFILVLSLGLIPDSVSFAQEQAKPWKRIKGNAVDVAVSGIGTIAVVNKSGKVYRFNHENKGWTLIGKNISRIAADPNGTFWGVDIRGNLRFFTGTQWKAVGNGAQDVVIDNTGKVYVTTNKDGIASFNQRSKKWKSIKGNAKSIAVDNNGLIWRISSTGEIARKLDDAWIGIQTKLIATDIDIDDKSRVFITANDGKLYLLNKASTEFEVYNDIGNNIAVSAASKQIWVIKKNGQIFAQGLDLRKRDSVIEIGEPGDGGSTDPAEIIDDSPIVLELIPDSTTLDDLSIGQDGSIFGLTSSGDIKRWSNNEQRFNDFPGNLERIVIQNNGLPLGIGANENLLEHDGEAWRQIVFAQELTDLALFEDQRILAVNASDRAIRLSENRRSFEQAGGPRAQQIAAQDDGTFWLIDNVNRLFQCTPTGQCERQSNNASDISIGPAGSVFIVDTNANLRRFNPNTKAFNLIRQGDTSRVAVGPQDRPWILDNQGRVLQSGYFERDESGDRRLALKTEATEDVTGEKPIDEDDPEDVIEIVRSIPFTAIQVPTSATGFPNLGGGLRDLTVGAGDIVLVTGYPSPCVEGNGANWVYNPNTTSFAHLDYLKGINLFTALALADPVMGDVNGDTPPAIPEPAISSFLGEWNKDCANKSNFLTYEDSIFTEPGAQASQDFNGAVFGVEQPLNVIPDLDVAADGTVVNVFGTELEFFHPETSNDVEFFDQIAFMRAGIGTNEKDIWAVSTTNNVYEFVEASDSFELRSEKPEDKAQDVGVGQDGTVFIVNMSGVLKKWDPVSGLFIRTTKTGVNRVAVDSKGNPIVANFPTSQTVFFGR